MQCSVPPAQEGCLGQPCHAAPLFSVCHCRAVPLVTAGHRAVCEQLPSLLTLHLLQPPAWTQLCLPYLQELHLQAALHCCPLRGCSWGIPSMERDAAGNLLLQSFLCRAAQEKAEPRLTGWADLQSVLDVSAFKRAS